MSYIKDKTKNRMLPKTIDEYIRIRNNGPKNVAEFDSFTAAEKWLASYQFPEGEKGNLVSIYNNHFIE